MVVWFAVLGGRRRRAGRRSTRRSSRALSPTYARRSSSSTTAGVGVPRARRRSCSRSPAPRRSTPTWATSARPPIRRAWFVARVPGADPQLLRAGRADPRATRSAIDNPFFLLFPHWARIPMVVLATVATVIASQAVISGAFSVTRQAVQLGFLPRLTIRHTSRAGGRPGLRARRQLGALRRGRRARDRLRLVRAPRRRPTASRSPARWRSTRPVLRRRPRAVAQAAAGS